MCCEGYICHKILLEPPTQFHVGFPGPGYYQPVTVCHQMTSLTESCWQRSKLDALPLLHVVNPNHVTFA